MVNRNLLIGVSIGAGIAAIVVGIVYAQVLSENTKVEQNAEKSLNVNWIGAFANVTEGSSPLSVSFKAQDFSQGRFGDISSIMWDFGDGNSSTSQNPTHVYESPGSYSVTLKATWEDRTSQTSNLKVIVTEPVVQKTESKGDLEISINPDEITVQQFHFGSTMNVIVNSVEGFSGQVSFRVEGLPDTMFVQWPDGNSVTINPGEESSLRLRIGESNGETELGSYEATIVADSGSISKIMKLTVEVVEMGQMMTGMGGHT